MELLSCSLDVETVLGQIAKTFRSTQDIRRQFDLDYYRMSVSLNNIAVTHEEFLEAIKPYYRYAVNVPGAPVISNLYYLIMILCTQASFFDAYTKLSEHYHLPDHEKSRHLMSSAGGQRDETDQSVSLSLRRELVIRFIKTFYCKDITDESIIASYQTVTSYRMEPLGASLSIEAVVEWCKM